MLSGVGKETGLKWWHLIVALGGHSRIREVVVDQLHENSLRFCEARVTLLFRGRTLRIKNLHFRFVSLFSHLIRYLVYFLCAIVENVY